MKDKAQIKTLNCIYFEVFCDASDDEKEINFQDEMHEFFDILTRNGGSVYKGWKLNFVKNIF